MGRILKWEVLLIISGIIQCDLYRLWSYKIKRAKQVWLIMVSLRSIRNMNCLRLSGIIMVSPMSANILSQMQLLWRSFSVKIYLQLSQWGIPGGGDLLRSPRNEVFLYASAD